MPRRQQIYPGEAVCALCVPIFHGRALHNRDVLYFIDNEAAASSWVRGTSTQEDVHDIALSAALWFHQAGCRVWYEWVDSKSNPPDGLSRQGVGDPWTASQGWDLSEVTLPRWLCSPHSLVEMWEAYLTNAL